MSIYGKGILEYSNILITEAYFGKSETLLEMEKQIRLIREKCKKYTDINKSKEVLALNRLFEKQFGMDIFSLHVEQNNTINAYTIPVATRFDIAFNDILSRKIEASQSTGYRFKPGNNLCIICNIYLGLLMHPEMTDGEILAIILHELGHNFADAIYKKIEVANKAAAKNYYSLLILYGILYGIMTLGLAVPLYIKSYRDNTNKVNKKRESKNKKRPLNGFISGIKATCSDFNSFINEVLARLMNSAYINSFKNSPGANKAEKNARKSIARQNEVIADKFAGIYGYGPELSSALIKMEKTISKAEEFTKKIPGIGSMCNDSYNDAIKDLYRFDCHPQVIQRINENIKTIERELSKSDLDPKLIEVMKKQLEELKKIKEEATKVVDDAQKDENIRNAFNQYVNDNDPNAIDDALEEEIENAFDDLLEN